MLAKFVKSPNLPVNTKFVILGERYYELLEKGLSRYDIDIIKLPPNTSVDKRISGHADISFFHYGENRLLISSHLKNTSFSEKLLKFGFYITYYEGKQGPSYPEDVALNACIINGNCICNSSTATNLITNDINIKKILNVKQGYTKCSVSIVNGESIITDDRGIALNAARNGIDSLLIDSGPVLLDGYNYGFIGGASFKISDDVLAFTGNLSNFSEYDRKNIYDFLDKHNVKPAYLTDLPAFDIGGGIPVIEK